MQSTIRAIIPKHPGIALLAAIVGYTLNASAAPGPSLSGEPVLGRASPPLPDSSDIRLCGAVLDGIADGSFTQGVVALGTGWNQANFDNVKVTPVTESVRIEKDVDYLGAGRTEKADLYLPTKVAPGERRPGIVIIHGGGWSGGDKAAARERNIGTTLAQHGCVCLSVNYVLSKVGATEVLWPRNLHDCKTAVRWLRKHAERLHLDPDHIGAIGGSAGGHLTAMVALTGAKDGLDPAGPYGEFSCRVQAAVDLYGPADL